MPYIGIPRRLEFSAEGLDTLCQSIRDRMRSSEDSFRAGDLAYIVYRLLLISAPRISNFDRRNAMMGGVDEGRMEYRRRIHEPAEDVAIRKNGDI